MLKIIVIAENNKFKGGGGGKRLIFNRGLISNKYYNAKASCLNMFYSHYRALNP